MCRHVFAVSAPSPLCAPCVCPVCHESATAASPNFVRIGSALCPLCRASKPCLPCVRLAFCPPPCVRYHGSAKALALPLDFARSEPVHHCATHRVYIAHPRVNFLHIIRPAQAQKLFGVYAGIILHGGQQVSAHETMKL